MANKIAVRTKALARRYGKPKSTPGWLALAVAALGMAGDVDFLVSLPSKWPMIVEFLDSWGALILMVLGFGWLWWVGREGDNANRGGDSPPQLDLRAMSDGGFRRYVMDLEAAARACLEAPFGEQSRYYVEIQGDAVATFNEAHKRGFMTDYERRKPGQAPPNQTACDWLGVVSQNIAKKTATVLVPKARSTPSIPRTEELPVKKQEVIERVRVLWRSKAEGASWSAIKLFAQIKSELESHTSLAELLQKPLDDLQTSREAVRLRVRDESTATISEVCQCFGEFHQRYRIVVQWFPLVERDGIKVTEKPYVAMYSQWQERHAVFRDKLLDILNRSDATELRKGMEDHGANLPVYD